MAVNNMKYKSMKNTKTPYKDICNKDIFVGDIVKYPRYRGSDFIIVGKVKFGEYKQDGSDGEYATTLCCGYYVEYSNMLYPSWVDKEDYKYYDLREYEKQQSLAEVVNETDVEIISVKIQE